MLNSKNVGFRKVVLSGFVTVSMLAFVVAPALTAFAQEDVTVSPTPDVTVTSDVSVSPTPDATVEPTPEVTPTPDVTVAPTPAPVLTTDAKDYVPGSTATILGSLFQAFQNLLLSIFGLNEDGSTYIAPTQTVTADENGTFTSYYTLDNIFRPSYNVVASDPDTGNVFAQTSFTDGSTNFDQCANNAGTPGTCSWIGSILHAPNSTYVEGMSVPQRIFFQGVGNGNHTVSFTYSYTKGGIHAYDFITGKNQGNASFLPGVTTFNDCQGLSGAAGTACNALSPSAGLGALVFIPTDNFVSKDGNQNIKEAAYPTRSLSIYTSGTLNSSNIPAVTHSVANGGDTGDSDATLTLNFNVTGCTGGGCNVLIYFDGHLAVGGTDNSGVNWGPGLGSSNISGGPYHVKDLKLDGNGGSLDNQIMGASILPPPTPSQATLTLLKNVVNDNGGTALDTAWTLSAAGPTPVSGVEGNAAVTGALVDAGDYTLSESAGPSGYTGGTYSCVVNSGAPVVSNSLTLAASDVATCTVTNNDQPGTLHVVKVVDNGSTGAVAGPSAFSFQVNGGGATAFESDGQNDMTVNAGTYSVTEPAVSGYSTSYNNCSGVVVTNGGEATCTVTNTAIAPTLKLVKTVVTDNGGTATAANFQGKVDGNNVAWEAVTNVTVGSHTASEVNLPGYTAGDWGTDCAVDGSVTLALGQNKVCTITNDDIQPKLTLVKTVINDNGGTLHVSDFPLFVNTTGVISGVANGLNAGSYTASETNQTGYAAGTWGGACAANGTVTLAVGDDKTCTITNDDVAPKLHLRKVVVNNYGGEATVDDFTLTADGTTTNDFYGTSPVDSGTSLLADTFALSETGPSGYASSVWVCVGGTQAGSNITVGIGSEATCTITNDDIQPKLTVTKVVVDEFGGSKEVADFPLFVSGSPVVSGEQNGFNVGNYTISETGDAGYSAVISGDCHADGAVSLALADEKECIITNTAIPAEIHGSKFEDVNGNGVWDSGESALAGWTINLTGTENGTAVTDANGNYSFTDLSVGTYIVTETQQIGWTQTTANPSAITVGLADVINHVNFGNFKNVTVSGYKWKDADGSLSFDSGDVKLAGWTVFADANSNGVLDSGEVSAITDANGNYTLSFGPGTYQVCEVMQPGWSQTVPAVSTGSTCYPLGSGSVTSGASYTDLNFGNMNEHEGTIGFWRNWNRHKKFTQAEIDAMLASINSGSGWLMSEANYPVNTTGMVSLINDATKYCSTQPDKITCASKKFLAQYMVNWLNVLSGKKSWANVYNLSAFSPAMNYLGLGSGNSVTLGQYKIAVEARVSTNPSRNQYLWMAGVSDYINNQGL